jgi:phage FluMu gp28-like protein
MKAITQSFFLQYQVDWILDNSRLKILEKSRQIGTTLATAYGTVRRHASRQNNYDSWITSRDELQAKLFRNDSKKFAKILSRARHSPEFQQILKKIRKFKYSKALQKLREGV